MNSPTDKSASFQFTFQYVSIKSQTAVTPERDMHNLHSNMSLLNHSAALIPAHNFCYLHSNMSLLNRRHDRPHIQQDKHLHSNMSLLNRLPVSWTADVRNTFTFQYVSIKSLSRLPLQQALS